MPRFNMVRRGRIDITKPPIVPAALVGINEGALSQDKPSDWARDLWWSGQFRGMAYQYDSEPVTGILHRTVDGAPTNYFPTESSIRWITNIDRSNPERAGVYTLTYPPAMTIAIAIANGATIVQAFSGGTGKVNLPPVAAGTDASVTFTVSGPIPPEGIKISMTKDSDNSTGIYSTPAITALAALGKINRSMTARNVNDDFLGLTSTGQFIRRSAAQRFRGPVNQMGSLAGGDRRSNNPMGVELQVEACTRAGQHMWHNAGHIDDDSVHAAEAAYVAANLPRNRAAYVEYVNEIWNRQFAQARNIMMFGLADGFGPVSATSATAVPETIIWNSTSKSISISATTVYDCAAGDKIFMVFGAGWQVYQALAANPAGSTVENMTNEGQVSSDGKWKLLYNNASMTRATARHVSNRSRQIWEIWDRAFYDARRPRPFHVLGHQAALPLNFSSTLKTTDILDFEDTHRVVDRVATAPYWGYGIGTGMTDMGVYGTDYPSPTYPNPWTATEKAIVAGGNLDPFFAAAPSSVDAAVAQYASLKTQLATYCTGKGRPSDAIRMCCYEANCHALLSGWPTELQPGITAAWKAIWRDPRFGDLTTRYLNGLLAVGGEIVMFDRIANIPSSYPPNAFGLQETDTDFRGRYTAVAALNAAFG